MFHTSLFLERLIINYLRCQFGQKSVPVLTKSCHQKIRKYFICVTNAHSPLTVHHSPLTIHHSPPHLSFLFFLKSLTTISMATPKKNDPPIPAVAIRHASWFSIPREILLMLIAVSASEIKYATTRRVFSFAQKIITRVLKAAVAVALFSRSNAFQCNNL